MTAVTAYFDWEKPVDFTSGGREFIASSEVAEALAGFIEPSDCPLFHIDDIFNAAADDNFFDSAADDKFFTSVADSVLAAAPDNLVASHTPPDHCSLHCCAKRRRCCYSGEPHQPPCFTAEQTLCFPAEVASGEPQQPLCFSAEFAEPEQSLCFAAEFAAAEPRQSLCLEAEFSPAEAPEPHYLQPTPLAELPEPPPPPPQDFEQTPFSAEFAFDPPPPKTAAGCGLSAQSAAARERRKRISDKTQELSRLIPGGGKMNTAEMLQAAHNYVRFLQAQIGILELDKEKSGEEEELLQLLISSTAIQEKLSKQGMCLVPTVIAEEFMKKEINQLSELL